MPVTEYTWDPANDSILEETDGAGSALASYTNEPSAYGPLVSQHRGGESRHFHFDALGSTRELTDDNEIVTDAFAYDAWGNVVLRTGATSTPFRWIGELGYNTSDVTPTYIRARLYHPHVCRWSSHDKYLTKLSTYAYTYNSPVSTDDASGLYPSSSVMQMAAAVQPIFHRPPWMLSVLAIRLLTNKTPDFLLLWVASARSRALPDPIEQLWLLTTFSITAITADCRYMEQHGVIIDVHPIGSNDGYVELPPDYSVVKDGFPGACRLDASVGKLIAINGADPASRLRECDDFHNPPQSMVDRIISEGRAKAGFIHTYTFIDSACLAKCFPRECGGAPPGIEECISGPWGEVCNQDYEPAV